MPLVESMALLTTTPLRSSLGAAIALLLLCFRLIESFTCSKPSLKPFSCLFVSLFFLSNRVLCAGIPGRSQTKCTGVPGSFWICPSAPVFLVAWCQCAGVPGHLVSFLPLPNAPVFLVAWCQCAGVPGRLVLLLLVNLLLLIVARFPGLCYGGCPANAPCALRWISSR